MIFAAPFWSVFTLNAAFLLVIYDVKSGRLPPWLIAVPIIYFGGYAALTTASHMELERTKKELAAQNALVKAPFDPNSQVLVFENKASSVDIFWLARDVLYSYDVPVVFHLQKERHNRVKSKSSRIERIPSGVSLFPRNMDVAIDKENDIFRQLIYENKDFPRRKIDGWCLVTRPEEITLPACRIWLEEKREENWFLGKELKIVHICDAEGRDYELTTATMYPLTWLPLPVLGYALNSGGPSWKNISGFGKSYEAGLPPEELMAQALALKKETLAARFKGK